MTSVVLFSIMQKKMEDEGHRILKLNIGNSRSFVWKPPDDILKDVIHNLPKSQGLLRC